MVWPTEEYGSAHYFEEVTFQLCDTCPHTYIEWDTGAVCCDCYFDCYSNSCKRGDSVREIEEFFVRKLIPFLKERMEDRY